MDDLRYDHALAAMMLILELFDSSMPRYQLASTIQFIVLECLKRYEAETRQAINHSVN